MKRKVSVKSIFIWNFIGSMSNSLVSFLLLMAVTRSFDVEKSDIFSIAWSLAQMMLTVATFQVRIFQATDTNGQFEFKRYFQLRIITICLMLLISVLYVVTNSFSFYKSSVVLVLCLYRAVDAFGDVFEGFFQQKERLDLSGKALSVRVVLSAVCFFIAILLTNNLLVSCFAMVVSATICVLFTDLIWFRKLNERRLSSNSKLNDVFILAKKSTPLFINAFCIMYIYNLPKLSIESAVANGVLEKGAQTIFNVVFMPAFVINLFLIILRPLITKLAIMWNDRRIKEFRSVMRKIELSIGIIAIACVIGGMVIGLPILSWMYSINLKNYALALLLVLLGGGINSMFNMLDNAITIMRKQHLILVAYIVGVVVTFFVSKICINNWGIIGASVSYVISMGTLFGILALIYLCCINNFKRTEGSKE